jgi:hypothetical protein
MTTNIRKPQPLPDLNDPVIDRRRRFTPTWYRWIKPLLNSTVDLKTNLEATDALVTSNTAAITTEASVRASADSALATSITTLTATVNNNAIASSAAITNEQTARANADSALASSISTLSTTVNGNTNSISTLSQSIDGVRAQWSVQINQNNQVTGLLRLDAGANTSTFTVLADRFIVANPNTPANTLQLFTTGSLAGAPGQVGVDAFFILDGTIVARHIAVDTLSAITANIGTVTAGRLQSADGNMVIDLDAKTITIST